MYLFIHHAKCNYRSANERPGPHPLSNRIRRSQFFSTGLLTCSLFALLFSPSSVDELVDYSLAYSNRHNVLSIGALIVLAEGKTFVWLLEGWSNKSEPRNQGSTRSLPLLPSAVDSLGNLAANSYRNWLPGYPSISLLSTFPLKIYSHYVVVDTRTNM